MTDNQRLPATSKSGIIIGKSFNGSLPSMSDEDRKLQAALLDTAKTQHHTVWRKVVFRLRRLLS